MINKNSAVARFAMKFLKALAQVIIGIVFLIAIAINWDLVAMGRVVRGKHFVGLLVKPSEGWEPTKELVLSLEDDLQRYVIQTQGKDDWITEHLSEYKVQYFGYIRDGKKILQINFNHNSSVEYGLWKIPFGVLGGGRNHFKVLYDMSQKKFTGLWVNYEA